MISANSDFKARVHSVVNSIPIGKIMSYGQIAALSGNPRAARIVGGVAHWGDQNLPWHRVVHKDGRLATGYPGGVVAQKKHLEAEGIIVDTEFKVDVTLLRWMP